MVFRNVRHRLGTGCAAGASLPGMGMDAASGDICWTGRKREVLELIARSKTNAEIAEALGVSLAGAKWHVSEVLSVLGVDSREQAAAYWRERNALSRRVSRGVKALLGPVLSWKAAAGAGGAAAMAGGVIVVAGLGADGTGSGGLPWTDPAAGSVQTTATPEPWSIERATFVPITTVLLKDGNSVTLFAPLGPEFAIKPVHSKEGWDNVYRAHSRTAEFEPRVFMGFGNQHVGLFYGSTSTEADHVELSLYDGRTIEVPLVDLPVELGISARFWAYEFDPRSLVGEMRAVAKDGTVLDRETIFQPPGYVPPPGQTRSGPLNELIELGSGRADPNSGTIPFSGGRPGSLAHPGGGAYHFRVEHDGTRPLTLVFWCATGVIPLTWLEGPDAAGNGVVSAQVPPNSAACRFNVGGQDGTYRITAIAGP